MICETCAKTADLNRKLYRNSLTKMAAYPHPKKCGCACQHRKPAQWDKFFSVEEPGEEDSESSE